MSFDTLRFGLIFVVLVWSIISVILYAVRRGGNRNALRRIKRQGQPLRRLSAEERLLVQPFLVNRVRSANAVKLISDEVFPLRGAFVSHGLTVQHHTTLHDTIGGVEVMLPYDARGYLREDNQAEVVMTEKFAIVLTLNGEFDLAGGREREARRQKQNQQWASGKPGTLQDVIAADDSTVADGAGQTPGVQAGSEHAREREHKHEHEHELEQAARVDILSQRDETPGEIAYRQPAGLALGPAALWLGAFVCLGVTRSGWAWMAAAAVLTVLALWLTWRRQPLGEPRKVNRARGELHAVVLSNSSNSSVVLPQMFLGNKLPVSLPEHWRANLELPDDGQVDIDMRVDDYAVLRLGKRYSVDEEQRLFPRVYWGRHVTLSLTALLAVAALGLAAADLKSDIALASDWIRAAQPGVYDSAEALTRNPPAPGDMVALKGAGRCQFQIDRRYSEPMRFDCDRVRWQGEAIQTGDLSVDTASQQLESGEFLKTRPASVGGNDPVSRYRYLLTAKIYDARVLMVSHVTDLVLTIEQACKAAPNGSIDECDLLKASLVKSLILTRDQPGNWPDLLRLAQTGAFKQKDNSDEGAMLDRDADRLRDLAASSMQSQVRAAIVQSRLDMMARQRGGVVLQVLPGRYADLPELLNQGQPYDRTRQTWKQQAAMMAAGGAMPFQVGGIVTSVDHDATGAPVIGIDARRSLDDPWSALAHVLCLALAIALLALHAPLAALRLRSQTARKRALAQYIQRSGSVQMAFF